MSSCASNLGKFHYLNLFYCDLDIAYLENYQAKSKQMNILSKSIAHCFPLHEKGGLSSQIDIKFQ